MDFAATDVPHLPYTLAVQPNQTLIMRVDQYLEANIAWPAAPDTATLILIEAGPYGGEVSVPAWPENVDFRFDQYTDDNGNHAAMGDDKYTADRDDNGADINLSWDNPKFDGKVAWIDMEFNDTSRNTGWKHLTSIYGDTADEYNGMLRGDGGSGADQIMTTRSYFADTWNPSGRGLQIAYHPYISKEALEYPEQWTLVTRFRMPEYSNTVGITIGANYTGAPDFAGEDYGVLVLATGQLKGGTTRGIVTDDDMESDELFLWYIPNNSTEGMVKLATINVPCVTESYHLLTIRYDCGHVQIFFEGNQLADVILPEGAKIGPGMQFGKLMGSDQYVDEGLRDMLEYVKSMHVSDDENKERVGVVDFLRIYRGLISDTALHQLVCQYPYTHQDRITNEFVSNVRYVRELNDGGTVQWVQEGAWRREYTSDGISWAGNDYYAEPAEGAVVIIECGTTTTIEVNTTKHGVFPSADRTYAQLIVRDGWKVGWWERRTGDLTIKPCEGWYTEKVSPESDEYKYGRIIFSGGAGQAAAWREDDEEKGGSADAAITWNNLTLHASVVDISRAGLSFKDRKTVEVRVEDPAFFRDTPEDTLMFVKQLTGPVSGTGLFSANTDKATIDYFDQVSEFVWVPACHKTGNWKIDDVTRQYNSTIEVSGDVKRPKTGLFVRALRVPGILYLEQNEDDVNGNGELSAQDWYRYGYHNDTAEESAWGLTPAPMEEGDFEKASILKIRLKDGTTETLRVNTNPDIRELYVEAPKSDSVATDEGLRLLPGISGTRLTVADEIVTERRLEVYDPAVQGSEAGGTGLDGILLQPKTEEVVDVDGNPTQVITGGTLLHGVENGVYAAGNTSVNYPLEGSSIARLESVGTIRFTDEQRLPKTTVSAAENATLEQTAADKPFAAQAMELAQGGRFTFASSEATMDESITLTGNATLEGTGTVAALTPAQGIRGEGDGAALTLNAAEGAAWRLYTEEVASLPLTKTGPGTVDFATDLPPNAGKVDVQEGTLLVPTGIPGAGEAIGQGGLNVDEGATLAPTGATVTDDAVAEIPAGQTVSGLGSIAGQLRLNKGALLDATEAFADGDALHTLTVDTLTTDGATALADIDVALPESTQSGLVFLRSNETTLNWDARARLLAKANGTRWDVFLKYRPDQTTAVGTNYLVDVAGLDVPTFPPDEKQPGEGENEWPDEDGDGSDTGDELGDQIQEGGNAAGGAEGYTMATTKRLTATDIAHVYDCFGSVWTYARRNNDRASEDYATIDLLMAYEFGISRMAFTQDGNHIVIEATLRNALNDCGYFTDEQLQGAGALKPIFLTGVTVAIVGKDGTPLKDVEEINASTAASHGFTPIETATETARWFLVPYNDPNFPEGTATNLTVRALPPAEQTATPEN